MNIHHQLAEVQERFSGTYTLYAEHLGTGEAISFGDVDRPMETASVMKLPILVEALRQCREGNLHLEQLIERQADDEVGGSGLLQHLSAGLRLPLRDVLTLMIIVSDNIATNMALRLIGIDAVNRLCRELELHHTTIYRDIRFDRPDPLAVSTPHDIVTLLKAVYRRTVLDDTWAERALDILGRQQYNTLLTRHMPYDLIDDNEDEPPAVRVLSKSGALTGVRNDAGLVLTPWGDYAIAIMSEGSNDPRFHQDTEALLVLPEASRAVFDYFCSGAKTPTR